MTGESPRRKQALSVFLSTLMVLSVLAMGMAGFAGSAAASPPDDGNFDGFVASNPSGGTGSANFVVTINATDSGLVGNNLASVDENSPTVNITFPDAVDASGLDTASGSVDIEVVGPSGSLDHNLGVSNNDQIVVDQSNSRVNLTIDSQNTQINEGDLIRVVLSGDNIDYSSVDTSNSPFDVTTEVYQTGDSVGSPSQSKTLTWVLPGPIEHSDVNGNFYSLESAIDAVDSDGEYVNVTGDVSDINNEVGYEFDELEEFLTQPTAAGSTDEFDMVDKADLDNDADIVADGNVPIVWSDVGTNAAGDELVQVGASKTVVFDGLDIRGEGFISDRANQFLDTDASGADITVKNSNFDTFDDTVLSVTNAPSGVAIENNDFDGDTADDYVGVSITDTDGNVDIGTSGAGNTFTNVSDGTGISVTTDSNADLVNITDNTIGIDDGNGIDIDTSNQDSTVDISGNDITSDTSSGNGVIVNSDNSDTDATVDISGGTIDNVTDAVDAADDATQFEGSYLNVTGVEMTNLQGASSNGITVTENTAGRLDLLVVDDVTIEGDSQTTGVNTDAQANTDVLNSVINNTNIGVNAQGSDADFNVSNTEITNSNTHAVQISDSGNNAGTFRVDQGTVIDQAGSQGIEIAALDNDNDAVEVDNVEINGTAIGIRYNDATNTPDINITNSDITHAGTAGVQLNDNGADGTQIRAHFNTFSDNAIGIETATDFQSNDGVSLTFNDFVGNNANGYEDSQGQSNIEVNANYNWWGDATGPNGTVTDAYGTGDNVTLSSSSDASLFPHLKHSYTEFSDDQLNGEQLVLIENPKHPQIVETAKVHVTIFDESQGVTADNIVTTGDSAWETLADPSGSSTLSPSNVATFDARALEKGDYQITAQISEIGNDQITQRVTSDTVDSVSVSEDDGATTLGSDGQLNLTATVSDADGDAVLRQGKSVTYTTDGFSAAGVKLTNNGAERSNTNNEGEVIFAIEPDGNNFTPGESASVDVQVGSTSETFTFNTAAGEAANNNLYLNGNDFGSDVSGTGAPQVNTTHELTANVTDSAQNPLNRTVTFEANASVFDGATSTTATSGDDGNATVEFTLPESVGTTELSASVGDLTNASNITTNAGDATTLGFTSETRSFAPGASTQTIDVQLEDEFGNANTSASVTNGLSVTSSDTDVLTASVNDEDLSDGQGSIDLTPESAGSATINVTADDSAISGVEDTFSVIDPETGELTLTVEHNVAVESANAQNQANLTAQFTDADGEALSVSGEDITFVRDEGTSAELNQSDTFTKTTDADGNVTIHVNGTTTTGESTFTAFADNYSLEGSETVTTTGAANDISVSAETDSVAAGTEVTNVTAEYVDSEGRNVPLLADLNARVSGDNAGQIEEGAVTPSVTDAGEVVSEFTYNATGAESGDVEIRAFGSGLSDTTTVTVTADGETPGERPADLPDAVSTEAFNAVDSGGDGSLSPSEIALAINENAEQGSVNGVEVSPSEFALMINWNADQSEN